MLTGVLAGLMTGALWGLTFVAPRAVEPFSTIDLAIARYMIFGLTSGLLMIWVRFRPRGLTLKMSLVAMLLGSVGYIGYFVAASYAVRFAGAAIPPLVIGLLPVGLAVIGNWTNADVHWRRLIVPLSLIVAGVLAVNVWTFENANADGEREEVFKGLACAVVALVIWVVYGVVNAKAMRAAGAPDPLVWTGLQGIGAGLGTLVLVALVGLGADTAIHVYSLTSDVGIRFLAWAFVMGVAGSWVATWCWSIASRNLPLSLSAQLIVAETVFGLAYGFVYEHRWPAYAEILGILLQMVGVGLAISEFYSTGVASRSKAVAKSAS